MITTLTSIVNTLVATGVVDFSADYKITNKNHVYVYYVDGEEAEVLLDQVSLFTAGAPNEYKINAITESGFNIELRDAYTTSDGRKISIRRILPLTQEVDYPPGNDFPAATHERALDKLTGIVQQFHEEIGRQIGMPLSEDATETNLPSFIPNAYLGLDGDNAFVWKDGTGAPGNDEIKASHIDWGTGTDQVKASDMPIEDAGSIITATDVEGALQENRAALDVVEADLVTESAALETHKAADGKEHSDVVLNNTHRSSNGTDHTYINQDLRTTASPIFNGISTTLGHQLHGSIETIPKTEDFIFDEISPAIPNNGNEIVLAGTSVHDTLKYVFYKAERIDTNNIRLHYVNGTNITYFTITNGGSTEYSIVLAW